jgi:hypothetical protein
MKFRKHKSHKSHKARNKKKSHKRHKAIRTKVKSRRSRKTRRTKTKTRVKAGDTERKIYEQKLVDAIGDNKLDEVKNAAGQLKKLMTDDEKKHGYYGDGDTEQGIFNFAPYITQGLAPLQDYNKWDPLLWALYLTLETALDNVKRSDIKTTRHGIVFGINNHQLETRWKIVEYLIKAEPNYKLIPLLEEYFNFYLHIDRNSRPSNSNASWGEEEETLSFVYDYINNRVQDIFRARLRKENE